VNLTILGPVLLRLEARLATGEASASRPAGLPVGSVVNDFELRDLHGTPVARSRWRGRRVLLIFFDADGAASRALLPGLAGLEPEPTDGRPVPVVLARGDADEVRDLMLAHGVRCPVLLQEHDAVANLYRVTEMPAGYVLDEEGRTRTALVVGVEALLDHAAATELPVLEAPVPGAGDDGDVIAAGVAVGAETVLAPGATPWTPWHGDDRDAEVLAQH